MGRKPTAWYWKARKCWAVDLGGDRFRLGTDKDDAKRELHRLLSLQPEERKPKVEAPPATGLTVATIFDLFLDWVQRNRAPRTYDWYLSHLQSFSDFLKKPDQMPIANLKPYMVIDWIDSHGWHGNFKRGAIVAIQRSCNWSLKTGRISVSPIPFIEKPQATRREQVITVEEWETIRDHYDEGDCFRELLTASWEMGTRPQEIRAVEARHVQLAAHRIVFPAKEAKGKKRIRVIYMTPAAEQIIRKLLKLRPKGLLFLNAKGRPWNYASMNCRFGRLKKHLGVKYAAYSLRHGFCQRMLENGVDHVTVSQLMGHSNSVMVSTVYSHMNQAHDHLKEALRKGSINGSTSA